MARGPRVWRALLAGVIAAGLAGRDAAAEPFVGQGSAERSAKEPAAARTKAIARARKAALQAALATLTKTDKAARTQLLRTSDAWTGAYRVLAERDGPDTISVEVEVDIDLARLTKRVTVAAPSELVPLFSIGRATVADSCGVAGDVRARINDELIALGGIGSGGQPLELTVRCTAMGAVTNTTQFAARVELVGTAGGRTQALGDATAFAVDPQAAMAAAIGQAAGELGTKLARHRRGQVLLRVRGAQPAVRLVRFERALVQSVVGVISVELGGVDGTKTVLLRVRGPADAQALARALESMHAPGVHVGPAAVEGADDVAIALQ